MKRMTYGDVLRLALSDGHTSVLPDSRTLSRACPATDAKSAKRTGNVIDGQFEMFRNRNGQLVFIGEDGQFILK